MVYNDEVTVKTKMKSNKFREQVNSVTSWFGSWSTCEQTVALYSLLKQIPPLNCRFLVQMLQQRISEDKQVMVQEEEANDPVYISKLSSEPKERVIQELLNHLPLLHSGNAKAKVEYLNLIPSILSHSIEQGVFIEESRQLLSYSLIHPAITSEERSKFNMWLGHLDQRFNTSNYHSPSQQGQSDDGQGQQFSHQGVDNGVQSNVRMPNVTINVMTQNAIGTGRVNGWNVNNTTHQSNESLNMNTNGLEGHGGSQGNLPSNSYQGNLPSNGYQVHQQQMLQQRGAPQHMSLHATHSAPPNFQMTPSSTKMQPTSSQVVSRTQQPAPAQHAPLRRMQSVAPPQSLPVDSHVSDWLNSNDAHLVQAPGRPRSVQSDHAPLSPQSSTASSGSGSDPHGEEAQQFVRNTFMEEESGMRDVPLWLKSLRLHKYAYLFQQLTYDEMFEISDGWLEQHNITKGARNKIILCIKKLEERPGFLKGLEQDISKGGSLKNCIEEMKMMLNSPIKAFMKSGTGDAVSPTSPNPDGDSIQDGDLPGLFTRLMTKVYSQLMLASSYDDEGLTMFLQLIDKCINHMAFTQKQKKLLDSFKQQARKIWQPAPYKYGFDKKPRPFWGNTFPMAVNGVFNNYPGQRSGVKTPPKLTTQSGTHWSFGAKRSFVGGVGTGGGGTVNYNGGHMPLQRNNSHNTAIFSRPNFIEQQPMKQQVTRTHSAPQGSHAVMFGNASGEQAATDTEINARLDSLCRSVTECALGSSGMSTCTTAGLEVTDTGTVVSIMERNSIQPSGALASEGNRELVSRF